MQIKKLEKEDFNMCKNLLSGEQNRRLFILSLVSFEEWSNIYG